MKRVRTSQRWLKFLGGCVRLVPAGACGLETDAVAVEFPGDVTVKQRTSARVAPDALAPLPLTIGTTRAADGRPEVAWLRCKPDAP